MAEHRVAAFAKSMAIFDRWLANTGLPTTLAAWRISMMADVDACRENNWLFTGIVCLSDWREIRDVERILEAAKTLIVPLPRRGRGDEAAQAVVGAAAPADDAAHVLARLSGRDDSGVTMGECIRYLHTHYSGTFSMDQLRNITASDLRRLRGYSIAALAAELSPINEGGPVYRRAFADLSRRVLEHADVRIANPLIFNTTSPVDTPSVIAPGEFIVPSSLVVPNDILERRTPPPRRRVIPVGDVLRDTMRAAREEGATADGRRPRRPQPRNDDPVL